MLVLFFEEVINKCQQPWNSAYMLVLFFEEVINGCQQPSNSLHMSTNVCNLLMQARMNEMNRMASIKDWRLPLHSASLLLIVLSSQCAALNRRTNYCLLMCLKPSI